MREKPPTKSMSVAAMERTISKHETRIGQLEKALEALTRKVDAYTSATPIGPAPTPSKVGMLNDTMLFEAFAGITAAGVRFIPRNWLAVMVGYSPTSSTFHRVVGILRQRQLVYYPNTSTLALTQDGLEQIKDVRPLDLDEVFRMHLSRVFNRQEADVLAYLGTMPDQWVDREVIAAKLSISAANGNFQKDIAHLVKLGLLEMRPGSVRMQMGWWTSRTKPAPESKGAGND